MSRRVVAEASGSRGGRPGRDRAARDHSPPAASSPAKLPRYERPSFTLSEPMRKEINHLSTSTDDFRKYEHHMKLSARLLPKAVQGINDRLYLRRVAVERKATKRRENNTNEKSPADEELETILGRMEDEVPRASANAEAALRDVIDRHHDLENTRAALRETSTSVRNQPPPPSAQADAADRPERVKFQDLQDIDEYLASLQNEDEAAEEEEDGGAGSSNKKRRLSDANNPSGGRKRGVPGPHHYYTKARAAKADEYSKIQPHRKYAMDNTYVSLKRAWYDALHPDNDRDMPDAAQWFDEGGEPVLDFNGGPDSDEDLIVEREVVSLTCPLSLQRLTEPYTNTKCRHTFQKQAIHSYFQSLSPPRGRGPKIAKCPQSGCVANIQLDEFELDHRILRKIKRAKEQEDEAEDDESDSGANLMDESMVETGIRNLKQERNRR